MRYVIQHHINDNEHFDLMIEVESSLLSWRIPFNRMKDIVNGKMVEIKKIADHRKAYLAYEGPVSQGRGEVKIYDSGTYELLNVRSPEYEFNGKVLKGRVIIVDKDELSLISYTAD